jgi:hypothetical protein
MRRKHATYPKKTLDKPSRANARLSTIYVTNVAATQNKTAANIK